ncbi:unnamed protein product [Adineta steineri]|uniref:Uncharacterized protein n=1 Tax=Adineta steineri TaxID=433720 RepID=A0A813XP50_9BILA|nr:unnamed protein product [Adineta steineri]CAF3659565.1 unnamed protein product [Adineta steineri]
MPLSIESEIDLLYHLSTMSEHVLPKGIFYLLLWKRLNQSSIPPNFSFNEMVDHLRTLYDESVFDNPELPESNDHDFKWIPINVKQEQQTEKDLSNKIEPTSSPSPPPQPSTPIVTKTRKRPMSPTSLTPNSDTGRRSGRQKLNPQIKEEEVEQSPSQQQQQQSKTDKRKSVKDTSRISTRSIPTSDSIGTRLRGQK